MPITKIVGGIIADGTIASADITDSTITNAKMAVDPSNASNLSSGDVPAAQLDNVPAVNLSPALDDIALLAFKTQVNGNLARYNLVDQFVDAFEDATGVDASASTNEARDSTGKYYFGGTSVTPTATGGAITTDGLYKIHTFTAASTTYTNDTAQTTEYVIVAGGGGGAASADGHQGGGGGGGGYRSSVIGESSGGGASAETAWSAGATSYTILVGSGGSGGGHNAFGSNGGDSTIQITGAPNINSTGGGGGGYGSNGSSYTQGQVGGSGGGSGSKDGATTSGGAGTANQGYAGGDANVSGGSIGGSGGGASAAGTSMTSSASAPGGAGLSTAISGTPTTYAVGGATADAGAAGGANTAEGGAGAYNGAPAYNGGSGIVILKRLIQETTSGQNLTLVSTATTTATAPTKGDLVFTYTNGSGTAVLGTNITADYSADDGSTWTDFGIGASDSQGTTGGHTIVTKNNVTLTSTSGTTMRYRIKTLVQSAGSMVTRIQAVSLGWS